MEGDDHARVNRNFVSCSACAQAMRESRFFVPPSDVRLKAVALTPTSEQQIGQMRA
jgi:hypothetical protein